MRKKREGDPKEDNGCPFVHAYVQVIVRQSQASHRMRARA